MATDIHKWKRDVTIHQKKESTQIRENDLDTEKMSEMQDSQGCISLRIKVKNSI